MKTVMLLPWRSKMNAEELKAFALAQALELVATKASPRMRDVIPLTVWNVAKRFPVGTDFRRDRTTLAEARQMIEFQAKHP